MTPFLSLYFDFIRALAAIIVVLHHYSQHLVKAEFGRVVFPHLGQEAVITFFVLSGFVISWVVDTRTPSVGGFLVKRLARFYSVMVPAITILGICYLVTMQLEPQLYQYQGDGEHFWLKSLFTLGFLNFNSVVYQVKLPGGSPFWSLTYEFWYYIVFALWVFSKRWWLPLLGTAVIFMFLGWDAFLLWPVWLIGVAIYWLSKRITLKPAQAQVLFGLSLSLIVNLYVSGWRYSVLAIDTYFPGLDNLRYAKAAPYFLCLGLMMGLNFLAVKAWSSKRQLALPTRVTKEIRHLAGVSFTLYLVHVPLMLLLRGLLGGYGVPFLIPILTIAIVYVIGRPIENSKTCYKQGLQSLGHYLHAITPCLGNRA